ncbi:MAG: AAA family ATPase [Candidatus Heimdallarchaeota archaeon]
MNLERVDISNFKSIYEAKCIISNRVTILAGKNESGKTNILEAISMLNSTKEFGDKDIPKDQDDLIPEITFTFRIDQADRENIEKHILEREPDFLAYFGSLYKWSNIIIVKRGFDSESRELSGPFIKHFYSVFNKNIDEEVAELNKQVQSLEKLNLNRNQLNKLIIDEPLDKSVIDNKRELLNQYKSQSIISEDMSSLIDNQYQLIASIIQMLVSLHEIIGRLTPRVVLFSSFEDILPHRVSIKDLVETIPHTKEQRIVMDLIKLAGINIEDLRNSDAQKLTKLLRKASNVCSKDFGENWNQEQIEITIDAKSDYLYIWVSDFEDEYPYQPEQRSKGIQWFMNFFLRLTSEGEDKRNIILIDEPGSYLHPKAQGDVLMFIEKLSKDNQIIFTTHSPYLIDTKKLVRVRLVKKDNLETGTKIENNFNKGSDYDTLTPIITAIGLDLSKGIEFSSKWNVLLEGVSDYHYLQSILDYLMSAENYQFPKDEIRFIPCIGHTQMSHILSILYGWGLGYIVLLDKKGTNKTYNVLIEDGIDEKFILFISKKEDESIEDLFTATDCKRYRIKEYMNSDSDLSKTIISKLFAEETNKETFTLNKTTITNFQKIFDEIKESTKSLEETDV